MNTCILHKIGLEIEFDFKSPISEVDVTTIRLGSTNTTNSLWPLTLLIKIIQLLTVQTPESSLFSFIFISLLSLQEQIFINLSSTRSQKGS